MAESPMHPIHLLGVNGAGAESGVLDMTDGHMIPLIQDIEAGGMAEMWGARHFDLMILDRDGSIATTWHMTEHDLADPAEYAALKALLLELANR